MITLSGEENYEEADRLLERAGDPMTPPDQQKMACARAQVHAILSLIQAQLAIATANIPAPEANGIWRGWGVDE